MKFGFLNLTAVAAASLLAACGGGSGGASVSSTLGGAVIDGYINGATVCIDLNSNLQCDANEPTTTSGRSGAYSFTGLDFDPAGYTVIAEVGTDAIDEDTGTNVTKAYSLAAPAADTEVTVTPLTTMVAVEVASSTVGTFEEKLARAKTAVALDLQLDEQDLTKDFVKEGLTDVHKIARATAAVIAESQSASLDTDDAKALAGDELVAFKKTLLKEVVATAKQSVASDLTAIKAKSLDEIDAHAQTLATAAAASVSGRVAQVVAGSKLGEPDVVDMKGALAAGFVIAQDDGSYHLNQEGACAYRDGGFLRVEYLLADTTKQKYVDQRLQWDWEADSGSWEKPCQSTPDYVLSSTGSWLKDTDGPPTQEDFAAAATFDQNCVAIAIAQDKGLTQNVCLAAVDLSGKTFADAIVGACDSDEGKLENNCSAVMPVGSIGYNATFSYNQDFYRLWYWENNDGVNAARQFDGSLQDFIWTQYQGDQWEGGSGDYSYDEASQSWSQEHVLYKVISVEGEQGAVKSGKVAWVWAKDMQADPEAAVANAETTDFVVESINGGVNVMRFKTSALERKADGQGAALAYFYAEVGADAPDQLGEQPGVYKGSVDLSGLSQQADFANPYAPKFMNKTLAEAAIAASKLPEFPFEQ